MSARDIVMAAAGGKPAGPTTLAYVSTSLVQAFGSNSYTFSSFPIGSPAADRQVIVAVGAYGAGIASVTVGGQPTTLLVNRSNGNNQIALYLTTSPISSGTTANIVVNRTSTGELTVSTYRATGLVSNTPVATAGTNTNGGSVSLSVLKDGFVVGFGTNRGWNGSGGSASWTVLTQNFFDDGYTKGVGYRSSGASLAITNNGTSTPSGFLGDSFEPAFVYASMR